MWKPKRLFSQNFEDLYLYRLFSGIDKGFYIDVGAWHPTQDSVTAIFYAQGWRGINIEPVKEIFAILQEHRTEDINLCLAVVGSPETASVLMHVVGDDPCQWGHHSVSSLLPGEQASVPESSPPISPRLVPASTLREVIDKYAMLQPISFLKLDIEGSEYQALLGLDLSTLREESRPQVIVVEATLPGNRLSSPCRQLCKDNLEENGYRYLFFDGLNDYYCDAPMYGAFVPLMLPPNIFDSPSVCASTMFGALSDKDADYAKYLYARNRISELESQLSSQTVLLEKAELVNAQLAGRSVRLQSDLDCLFEERIAIAKRVKTIRQVKQSDLSSPVSFNERSLGSSLPLRREIPDRTGIKDLDAPFKLAVYIHIPKCSGTSMLLPYLNNAEGMVRWLGVNASLVDLQQGISKDYPHSSALYCGHFFLKDIEAHRDMFPDCHVKYFAHIRDPMERAISYYNYIARMDDHPQRSLVTDFATDLQSWFGEMLLDQSQVKFISPTAALDLGAGSELFACLRSGVLRLFDSHNIVGCASEINLHTGISIPRHAHSLMHNKDLSADSGAGLSGISNLSSLSLLREICQIDIEFWDSLILHGFLS